MASEMEAIGLNNHGVALLAKGSVWEAYETFQYAQACLDEEQEWPHVCQCRLINTLGDLPFSLSEYNQRQCAQSDMSYEGKHCHIGYEWVDCKPIQKLPQNNVQIRGCSAHNAAHVTPSMASASRSGHHGPQPQQQPHNVQSTRSHVSPVVPFMTHDYSKLVFLSLGAVKINCDQNHMDTRPEHMQCYCATRWVISYNLGIVNHMVAIPLGERGHTFLKFAHHCYLQAQCTIPSGAPFGDIVRLLLSSQNNQMSIYQEFAMHAEFRICLDLLTRLLTTSISSAPTSTSAGSFTPTPPQTEKVATDDILLNLMVLMRPDSAPAA